MPSIKTGANNKNRHRHVDPEKNGFGNRETSLISELHPTCATKLHTVNSALTIEFTQQQQQHTITVNTVDWVEYNVPFGIEIALIDKSISTAIDRTGINPKQ